jgi:hypothetical protein
METSKSLPKLNLLQPLQKLNHIYLVSGLMLLGLLLRLPSLSLGLWRDEGSTYFDVLPSDLGKLIETVIYSELNPPGFYLIMHQWMQYIGHFGGITISGDAIIGKCCNLSQNVTIGVSGQGEKRGVPIIGDNVYIAPGARLFGKISIGNNVKIGANAVIYKDIPDNAVVVLDPGFKIISYKGNRNNEVVVKQDQIPIR